MDKIANIIVGDFSTVNYANKMLRTVRSFTYRTHCVLSFSTASVCDIVTCQNGGTCSVTPLGTASCACAAGYSGPTCASR